jgi:hypothetical protein
MADEEKKISTGTNDRPVDSSIAQTGPGLPDDSSLPPDVSEEEIERVREKMVESPRDKLKREVSEAEKASELGSE